MSELVPPEEIESIVGARRHSIKHLGRAVSATETIYILHSQHCKDSGIDLRECPFSNALDYGIDQPDWEGFEDRALVLAVDSDDLLVPAEVAHFREQAPPYTDHSEPVVYLVPEPHVSAARETIKTERAGSVADGNSNTPRGAVVESGVQPDAGEVDAEFESRPGPLSTSRPEPHDSGVAR